VIYTKWFDENDEVQPATTIFFLSLHIHCAFSFKKELQARWDEINTVIFTIGPNRASKMPLTFLFLIFINKILFVPKPFYLEYFFCNK